MKLLKIAAKKLLAYGSSNENNKSSIGKKLDLYIYLPRTLNLLIIMTISMFWSHNAQSEAKMLTIPFPKTAINLDPHRMEDWYSMAAVLQIHRGLFRYSPGGDVEQDLVESWEESSNKLSYKFKIGPHVFSDGTKISSRHVANSLLRLFVVNSSIAADLSYIKGAQDFIKTKKTNDIGIHAINEDTVEIQLEHVSGLLTKHLAVADCGILKIDFPDQNISFNSIPSSGPYQVVEANAERLVLKKWRNDRRDSKNPPSSVTFITSSLKPEDLAKKGDVNTLDFVSLSDQNTEFLKKNGWKQYISAAMWEHFLILNPENLSKSLRRKIARRINQNKLVRENLNGSYKPAFGLIPTGLPGALDETEYLSTVDGETARKEPIQFTLSYVASQENLAKAFAHYMATEGTTVNLKNIPDVPSYLKALTTKNYDAILGSRGLDYPDGFSVLAYFREGYEGNYYHVHDSAIDKTLDAAAQILDSEKRAHEYRQISKKILGFHTIVPLVFGHSASGLWSSEVAFAPPHPMGFHQLPFESIEMVK